MIFVVSRDFCGCSVRARSAAGADQRASAAPKRHACPHAVRCPGDARTIVRPAAEQAGSAGTSPSCSAITPPAGARALAAVPSWPLRGRSQRPGSGAAAGVAAAASGPLVVAAREEVVVAAWAEQAEGIRAGRPSAYV